MTMQLDGQSSSRDREREGSSYDRDGASYAPPQAAASPTQRDRDREREREKERERAGRRQLGEWTLGKTLGAGSMGKVKLGVSSVTGPISPDGRSGASLV